jgi:hypothetical protein
MFAIHKGQIILSARERFPAVFRISFELRLIG